MIEIHPMATPEQKKREKKNMNERRQLYELNVRYKHL